MPTDTVDARVWPQLGGVDLSSHPLDEPVPLHLLPDPQEVQGNRSRFSLIVNLARRERLTLRQLLRRLAGARGHLTTAGTSRQVADLIEHWFTLGAADGFNVMPPLLPDHFDAFVDEVVPILRARGLTRSGYPDGTLRDYYGLPRPTSRHTEPAFLG
ncbi:hypothetical protein [Rugosimonospora africana]|uniref:hypothetical protein n=1 Tax=Rugosimonospora africana TaxID=556532 RepID=UPI001EF31EAE|nr:hypothetical protein [Rugosimonospora africana]